MKKYFTTLEAANICHVSQGSIIRWIHEGKVIASVTPGGHHRIDADHLRQFLNCLRMPVPTLLERQEESILLVTRNSKLGQVIKRWIQAGYPKVKLQVAREAFSAGVIASKFLPRLILADFEVETEAIHLCDAIRAVRTYENIPILVIAQAPSERIQRKMIGFGASGWICKPLEKDSFLLKVKTLLGSRCEFKRTGS